jgi:hypothetical protein
MLLNQRLLCFWPPVLGLAALVNGCTPLVKPEPIGDTDAEVTAKPKRDAGRSSLGDDTDPGADGMTDGTRDTGGAGRVPTSDGSVTRVAPGSPDAAAVTPTPGGRDASVAAKKTLGVSCTKAADCTSNACVDRVCCQSADCGSCQECGAGGACVSVRGRVDLDSCFAPRICNDSGKCSVMNGEACPGGAAQCASGICVDALCCTVSCAGLCSSCGPGGSSCAPVTGDDPNTCTDGNSCTRGECVAVDAQLLEGAQETAFGVGGLPTGVGQTILVTRTGTLLEVRVDLTCLSETDATSKIQVSIERLSAGALPTGQGGGRVYNAQVTTGVRFEHQLKAYRVLSGLGVVAGDRLAFTVSGLKLTDACMLRGSGTDAYAGGQAFQVTGGTVNIVNNRDYAFQTLIGTSASGL